MFCQVIKWYCSSVFGLFLSHSQILTDQPWALIRAAFGVQITLVWRWTHWTIDEITLTVSSCGVSVMLSSHINIRCRLQLSSTSEELNERRSCSPLHFEPILNTISKIFSCNVVHLVSQRLIVEEVLIWLALMPTDTLTDQVLAFYT